MSRSLCITIALLSSLPLLTFARLPLTFRAQQASRPAYPSTRRASYTSYFTSSHSSPAPAESASHETNQSALTQDASTESSTSSNAEYQGNQDAAQYNSPTSEQTPSQSSHTTESSPSTYQSEPSQGHSSASMQPIPAPESTTSTTTESSSTESSAASKSPTETYDSTESTTTSGSTTYESPSNTNGGSSVSNGSTSTNGSSNANGGSQSSATNTETTFEATLPATSSSATFAVHLSLTEAPITSTTSPPAPVEPTPLIPWGDWNLLIITDDHSWLAGHNPTHEPNLDVDAGHVVSFYQQLQEQARQQGRDIFLVHNGDWVDGTGLSINQDPTYLEPLLQRIPFDILTVGNHELYSSSLVQAMERPGGWVQAWGERYVTSNVWKKDKSAHLGRPYRIIYGRNTNVQLLVLGFLYEMKDASEMVIVQSIHETMQEKWMRDILKDTQSTNDGIIVMAHMHVTDALIQVILQGLRAKVGMDIPIVFVTGHTHIRAVDKPDATSISVESGKFMDSLGFVSVTMPVMEANDITPVVLRHSFLEASKKELEAALDRTDDWSTENGRELSDYIYETRESLGLLSVVACIPQTYNLNTSLYADNSLWKFFRNNVVPNQLGLHSNAFIMLAKDAWRYDMFSGDNTLDDVYKVSPYNDTLVQFVGLPWSAVLELNKTLNLNISTWYLPQLPETVLIGSNGEVGATLSASVDSAIEDNVTLVVELFQAGQLKSRLQKIYGDLQPYELYVPRNPEQHEHKAVTTTSVWLDYLKREMPRQSKCNSKGVHFANPFKGLGGGGSSSSASNSKSAYGTTHGSNHPSLHNKTKPTSRPSFLDNPAEDKRDLTFVVIAVSLVVLLGSVAIWQKGVQYRHERDTHDRVVMQALREYHADDGLAEEGEFI
jgi:2',3'-cyclic-nucleotide 2'-phosphodiesterase (5'-nucleotidase family)